VPPLFFLIACYNPPKLFRWHALIIAVLPPVSRPGVCRWNCQRAKSAQQKSRCINIFKRAEYPLEIFMSPYHVNYIRFGFKLYDLS